MSLFRCDKLYLSSFFIVFIRKFRHNTVQLQRDIVLNVHQCETQIRLWSHKRGPWIAHTSTNFMASLLLPLQWRHNERDGVPSNHRRLDCLLNRLFRRRSKKTSKLRVTGLCEENPPATGGFPSQRASYAENASIWLRHHIGSRYTYVPT